MDASKTCNLVKECVQSFADIVINYSPLFADIAVVLGAISVFFVARSYMHSVNSEKTKIFNDLRSKYGEVYSDIDEYVHKDGKYAEDLNYEDLKDDQKAISVLNRYWIHSFNEWFTANKIYKNDKRSLLLVTHLEITKMNT